MSTITLQVIQGLERGESYSNLQVPITIGREEENTIQLNDERISRCHVKIQRDHDRIILTDLESTNGTRVNGLPVQMTVLRPGDLVTVGRCVLMFGTDEEIEEYCNELHKRSLESHNLIEKGKTLSEGEPEENVEEHGRSNMDTLDLFDEHGFPAAPFPGGSPPIPHLSSLHSRSELSDLLSYLHCNLLQILDARGLNTPQTQEGQENEGEPLSYARIPWPHWHNLLQLENDLAKYLKEISEPD